MTKSETYDTRKYECCAPFYGEVGEEFTRRFKPEFEGALHSYVDNYASLFEHVVLQNDPGSAADPPAAGAAGTATRAMFAQRQKKSFGLIRKHIEDPTLRDMIDAQAMGNGPDAWQLINAQCTRPQTYLNLADQDLEWNNASIVEVGFNERTIENYNALLNRINRERPGAQAKSNIQIWQKLLEGIAAAGSNELKMMVRSELQRPTLIHGIASPLAGQPNIPECIMHFAERWRVLIHDGSIKQIAPRRRTVPQGNRVDALSATVTHESEGGSIHIGASLGTALAAKTPPALETEKICWNCRGLGHTKVDTSGKVICPSPVKPRPLGQCIAALEAARRKEAGRMGRRKLILRRPNAHARLANGAQEETIEVIVGEDGNVYSESGMLVGTLADEQTIRQEGDVEYDYSACNPEPSNAQPPDHTLSDNPLIEIDSDFSASFMSNAHVALATEPSQAEIDMETSPGTNRRRSLTTKAIMMTGGAMALITATIIPSKAAQRSLIMFGLLSMAAANKRPKGNIKLEIDTALLSAATDPNANVLNSRNAVAVDTGASMHVSGRRELFPDHLISKRAPTIRVEIANDVQCDVEFSGSMRIPVRYRTNIAVSKTSVGYLILNNALYVPALKDNTLISPRAMFRDQRIRTYFNDDKYLRMPDGKIIDMTETTTLYLLQMASPTKASKALKAKASTADELHSRCMHFSLDRIRRSSHCLENVRIQQAGLEPVECDACIKASARRHDAPPRSTVPFNNPGDCICSDTCDMGEYSTPFGFRYFISFLDMATTYIWIYYLRTHQHAEVRNSYLQFLADSKQYLHEGRIKLWFMDNGSEFNVSAGVGKDKPGFFANDTDTWLAEYFTRRRFIVPWNPQQNPAESTNRILLKPVRAALAHANVPTRLWPFAVNQGSILHNVLATLSITACHAQTSTVIAMLIKTIGEAADDTIARPLSAFQMLHKRRFDAELLHTLFCACDCLIRNPSDLANRPKAAPKTTPAVHLGLDTRRAGYFVYLIEFKRFTTSAYKDTYFTDEQKFPDIGSLIEGEVRQPDQAARLPTELEQTTSRPLPENSELNRPPVDEDRADRMLPDLPSSRTRSRFRPMHASLCQIDRVPEDFAIVAAEGQLALALKTDVWRPIACPSTTAEALANDKEGWLKAYRADFEAKMANGAFEFVERREGMSLHKCKWAHKLIWNDDNTLAEKRARLVGCGYSQVQGRDYTASYSSTPKAATVRLYEACIAYFDMEEEHCDVIKAFTQNKVSDVDLYIHQPPALPTAMDKKGRPLVIKVVMALEGFKQSGHLHQINHTHTFTHNDLVKFTITESEPTLLTHVDGDIRIMALIWTDDVHFAYSKAGKEKYEAFLDKVYGKRWNFKRKGPVCKFVGIDISRDRPAGAISLSMSSYITGVHSRFVQTGHIARSSPYKSVEALKSVTTAKDDTEREAMADKPFLAAVASCIWIYSMLRADISYVLNTLCGVMHDPSVAAWDVVLDLISYLMYTKDVTITYRKDSDMWNLHEAVTTRRTSVIAMGGLHCWVDASWKETSVAGYITLLAGGPIDWATKTIKVICHSSAEAEASAGCLAAKSLMYIREICRALGFAIDGPVLVLSDSEAAIAIGNNLGTTKRTAHFLRWQHYLRWCIRHYYIELMFVKGKKQLADSLTKGVDITTLRDFRKALYQM